MKINGSSISHPQVLTKLFLEVWCENNPPGLAKKHPLVVIDLKAEVEPIRKKKKSYILAAREGIKLHIDRLKEADILVECLSPWNTLTLPVKKDEYWSRLQFPSPGDLPDPGIEPRSPVLQADTLPSEPPGKPQKKDEQKDYQPA